MENISLACSEVYCILEILGDSYKNKLPIKFLEFINQNREEDFSLEINENEYENMKISKDGLVLISFLNLKYWVEDESEKQRLIEIYKKNDEKREEKINKYKDSDWLKQSNLSDSKTDNLEESTIVSDDNIKNQEKNALIETKKISFIDKIKTFIKKIFNK